MSDNGDRIPMIIDVDTGVDDAQALAMASGIPRVDLLAVTTVAGNVDVDRAFDNTRRAMAYLGRGDVPVYRGAHHPLARRHRAASHVHGLDGIGGAVLPEVTTPAAAELPGPAAILRIARSRPGEVTLVAVGPLTNVAIALNLDPELAGLLRRVVIMGGAFHVPGNVTPFAEFNIWEDPEAAAEVFEAGFADMTLVGLDVTHQVNLGFDSWTALGEQPAANRQAGLAHAVGDLSFRVQGLREVHLHDPLAVGVAVDPSLVTTESDSVEVVTSGEEDGRTVPTGPGPLRIATGVDVERFMAMYFEANGVPELASR